MVSILVKLGRLENEEKFYRSLLLTITSKLYFVGLQKCLCLYCENGKYKIDDIVHLDALYKSLRKQYPQSAAVKTTPYEVPSLFSVLSPLYHHPCKANILEQLFLHLESSLRSTGSFPGRTQKEPPSTLMWTLFYLAQHYDRCGQHDIALTKIDEAIEHTPTVIDLYFAKLCFALQFLISVVGKYSLYCKMGIGVLWWILEHAGDYIAAAAFADEARCMDRADQHLNSECVMQMLQAGQVALAEKTSVLFTKDGEQHNNLHDMQCMWCVLCYIKLHDSPLKPATEEESQMSKLDPLRKRKLRQAKKGRSSCKEKKNGDVSSAMSKSGKHQNGRPVDLDPHGEKLLQNNSSQSLETHILSFELNVRKQKILLAFQAVKRMLVLDDNNPDCHHCLDDLI
ncbi:putative transferase [Dioscorea sansibarensis]